MRPHRCGWRCPNFIRLLCFVMTYRTTAPHRHVYVCAYTCIHLHSGPLRHGVGRAAYQRAAGHHRRLQIRDGIHARTQTCLYTRLYTRLHTCLHTCRHTRLRARAHTGEDQSRQLSRGHDSRRSTRQAASCLLLRCCCSCHALAPCLARFLCLSSARVQPGLHFWLCVIVPAGGKFARACSSD